jgi:hypothetical protein
MDLDEMIAVLQAAKEGKEIEVQFPNTVGGQKWHDAISPIWNFSNGNYRIKPEPTREEITQTWVKDNNIEVGSKVKIVRPSERVYVWDNEKNQTIGQVCAVKKIEDDAISLIVGEINGWSYDVESLEPYKEEYIPFTFEDREMFRDKWIRLKTGKNEHKINFISPDSSVSCANWTQSESLSDLFKTHEFIDGTPFGKPKE